MFQNKLKIGLFVIGFAIQLSAFFGDHADELPFVIKLIAPKYFAASEGMKKIESGQELNSNDVGFAELSNLSLEGIKQFDNRTVVRTNIAKFLRIEGSMSVSSSGLTADGRFTRFLKFKVIPDARLAGNPTLVHRPLEDLQKEVDELKSTPTLAFCIIAFVVGSVFEFIACFFLESETPAHSKKAVPDAEGKE